MPIRIRESNPLEENVSNSLSKLSLIVCTTSSLSLCFFLSRLSREREKNCSKRDAFTVVISIIITTTEYYQHLQLVEREFLSRFSLFFLWSKNSVVFYSAFFSFASFVLSRLSPHIFFCLREKTQKTIHRPKIMVRSLSSIRIAFVFLVVFAFYFLFFARNARKSGRVAFAF